MYPFGKYTLNTPDSAACAAAFLPAHLPVFAVCAAVFLLSLLPAAELHAGTKTSVKTTSVTDYSEVFDGERCGTVTLNYLDSDGRPASGASFLFLQVALFENEASGGRITDSYSSLLKRKDGSVVPVTASSKAGDLLPYALDTWKTAISGNRSSLKKAGKKSVRKTSADGGSMIRAVSGKNGKLTLKDVPPGVWLVYEESAAKGFLRSEPFLFTLPLADSSSKGSGQSVTGWNYSVTLEPKAVRGKSTPTPTPKTEKKTTVPNKSTNPVKTGDRNRIELFAAIILFAFVLSMQLVRRRP